MEVFSKARAGGRIPARRARGRGYMVGIALWLLLTSCAESVTETVSTSVDASSTATIADVEVALAALSAAWEEEYTGTAPAVHFTLHWVESADLQALGWSSSVTGAAYDAGDEAAGKLVDVYLDSTLSAGRICALLIHEFAHGFEYATNVEELDHVTPEVWGDDGIVSQARVLAGSMGCVVSSVEDPMPTDVYTAAWYDGLAEDSDGGVL